MSFRYFYFLCRGPRILKPRVALVRVVIPAIRKQTKSGRNELVLTSTYLFKTLM